MSAFAYNILSGLLGALIGSFTAIFAVNRSHVLQCEAELRKLLVAERMAIRLMSTDDAQRKQQEDLLPIYQAYENLRSAYCWIKRKNLDARWRLYKGNNDNFAPLFGTFTTEEKEGVINTRSRSFTRDEIISNIDQLLRCVKY